MPAALAIAMARSGPLFRRDPAEEGEVAAAGSGENGYSDSGMPWWTVPTQLAKRSGLRWWSEIDTSGNRGQQR